MTRWIAALRQSVSRLASTSPGGTIGALLIAAVLASNYYIALELQWRLPTEESLELFLAPLAVAPLAGAMLACLHGLAPRHKWLAAAGLLCMTAVIMGAWIFVLVAPVVSIPCLIVGGIGYLGGMGTWIRPFTPVRSARTGLTVFAVLLLTYVNVLTLTYSPVVRAAAYPWRLAAAAMDEERDRLLAAAQALGIDRKKVLTKAEADALEQRLGPVRVVTLPLIGRSVKIRPHAYANETITMSIHWDDGRGGMIDLETLDVPYIWN